MQDIYWVYPLYLLPWFRCTMYLCIAHTWYTLTHAIAVDPEDFFKAISILNRFELLNPKIFTRYNWKSTRSPHSTLLDNCGRSFRAPSAASWQLRQWHDLHCLTQFFHKSTRMLWGFSKCKASGWLRGRFRAGSGQRSGMSSGTHFSHIGGTKCTVLVYWNSWKVASSVSRYVCEPGVSGSLRLQSMPAGFVLKCEWWTWQILLSGFGRSSSCGAHTCVGEVPIVIALEFGGNISGWVLHGSGKVLGRSWAGFQESSRQGFGKVPGSGRKYKEGRQSRVLDFVDEPSQIRCTKVSRRFS